MTLRNLVVAAVVTAIGGAAFVASLLMETGTAARPGPGTWPLLVAGALVVLGIVLAARARHTSDAEGFTRGGLLVVGGGLVSMVLFVVAVGTVGFEIPAVLLMVAWLRFLGRESWRLSLVVSLLVVAACYALFVGALGVTIPHLF